MRRFRVLSTLLCLLLCITFSFPLSFDLGYVSAKTESQIRNEMNEIEKKINSNKQKINELRNDQNRKEELRVELKNQISNIERQISICTQQIIDLDEKIQQNQAELDKKTVELNASKDDFKKRLRIMYMNGGNNGLELLLGSDDFADFLAKTELTKCISERDNALIENIINTINHIENIKVEIQAELDKQGQTKKTLAGKQSSMQSQILEVNALIAQINTNTADLNKQNSDYNNAINKLEDQIRSSYNNIDPNIDFGGQFAWPVPGYYNISSHYGMRWGRLHRGIDISSSGIYGKPIKATADGVVSIAGYNSGGYGNYVMVNHGRMNGNNYSTLYAHMTSYVVSSGQTVKRGQTIGYVGSTGNSTGPHLHYEIRVNGVSKNPLNYYNNIR